MTGPARWLRGLADRLHRFATATPERRQRFVELLTADRPELTEEQARRTLDAVGYRLSSARWCAQVAELARAQGVEVTADQVAEGLN